MLVLLVPYRIHGLHFASHYMLAANQPMRTCMGILLLLAVEVVVVDKVVVVVVEVVEVVEYKVVLGPC